MIYTAALSKRHPSATLELLAHQLTIIKASQQCDGLFWRAYDTLLHQRSSHREQNLVPLGHRPVHQVFFTGRAKQVTLCSVCDSTGHMAPDCPRRTCKWDFKLLTIQATPKRSVAGQCMRQVQHSGGVPVPGQVQVPPYLRGLQRQPPSQRLPPQGKPTKSEPSGGQPERRTRSHIASPPPPMLHNSLTNSATILNCILHTAMRAHVRPSSSMHAKHPCMIQHGQHVPYS